MGRCCPIPSPAWAEVPVLLGVRGLRVALLDAGLHPAVTSGSEGASGVGQGTRVLMPNASAPNRFPGGAGEWGQTGWVRGQGCRAGESKAGGDAGGIGWALPMPG